MSKPLKPQIRFKGYDGEWTTKSLSEPEFNIQAGGDVDKTLLHTSGEYPVIANALTDDGILGYYDEIYRIKAPAISVTGRGDVGIAIPRRTNFTPVVRLLALTSPHDIDFLSCAINLHPTVLESTGVPQLTVPKLQSYSINFPEKKEQKEIGQYFRQIDIQIKEAEREVDRLEKMKIASLQKMFPRPGATTPEIRFAGFSKPWQFIKLKQVCESFKYGLNAPSKKFDGVHKYLRITDIDDVIHQFNQTDLTSPDTESLSEEFKLQPNDIVFARTGASVGKTYLYNKRDGNVYWAGFLIRAKISKEHDSSFIFQMTNTKMYWDYITISSQRSGQPGVNAEQYAEFSLYVPTLAEQQKIGNYFRNLDELIAAKRKSIVKLRNIKKACLSKMFVNDTEL